MIKNIRIKPKESDKKQNDSEQYSFWQSIEQALYRLFK